MRRPAWWRKEASVLRASRSVGTVLFEESDMRGWIKAFGIPAAPCRRARQGR